MTWVFPNVLYCKMLLQIISALETCNNRYHILGSMLEGRDSAVILVVAVITLGMVQVDN